jgi:hypothetical protein
MANPNVKKQIDKIDDELQVLLKHVNQYSGISEKDAFYIDTRCSNIAQSAARIGAIARQARGDKTSKKLVRSVRKALGYTTT